MKAWIIPTIALLVIGGAGFGAGWAVNEWRDDDGEAVIGAEPTPADAGPTQAEIGAELQQEEDRLCLEARLADAIAERDFYVERQQRQGAAIQPVQPIEPVGGFRYYTPAELQTQINRYCE